MKETAGSAMPMPDVPQRFQRLFHEQPSLLSRLQGLRDATAAAEELARIGAENGIPTSAAEIHRYAAQTRRAAGNRALADAELDRLTGGVGSHDVTTLLVLFRGDTP